MAVVCLWDIFVISGDMIVNSILRSRATFSGRLFFVASGGTFGPSSLCVLVSLFCLFYRDHGT